MALSADAGLSPPSTYQLCSSQALPFGRYGTFCVSALVGLWPWPLTFWPWNWCDMVPSCQFWWYYIFNIIVVDLWVIGPTWLRLITWPCDLDLWPWRSWCLWLMRVVVLHPYIKFEVGRSWHSEDVAHDITFDLLTLKLVGESHQKWGTFLPNLCTLGLWVLELFAMYATGGRTDRRTDKSNAYCSLPYGGGITRCTIQNVGVK